MAGEHSTTEPTMLDEISWQHKLTYNALGGGRNKKNSPLETFYVYKSASIVGSVVECSPATRVARVRFPADARVLELHEPPATIGLQAPMQFSQRGGVLQQFPHLFCLRCHIPSLPGFRPPVRTNKQRRWSSALHAASVVQW